MAKNESIIFKVVVIVLVLFLYIPTFTWMKDRFLEIGTEYSHGFLIPPLIIYISWLKRKTLKQLPLAPSIWGLVTLIAGILIHLASLRLQIEFVSALSLLITIIGTILYLYGKDHLKLLSFPLFLYIFMVPLPSVFMAFLTFNLKMVAAAIATAIVKVGGIPVIREGSTITTPHSVLIIDDQCSGIRSLISLMALSSIYAYFSALSNKNKIILFLLAIPIAVVANIGRIILMVMVSFVYGSQIISNKVVHNGIGFILFTIAFILLFAAQKVLYEPKK